MNNTFLTPEVVAKEALMVLTSNLVMADLVHRDYSDELVSVGDTVSIRKPAKFVAKNFLGNTEAQDITEGSVSVKLDRFRDVTVAVTSKQMSLDIADFSAQVVEPAMQAIAQAIDEDILALAVSKAGYIKEGTEGAADLADIAAMAKHLDIAKAPIQNRSLVLHPEHKYRYALTENLSNVSYAGDNETLRDALLGRVYTLDTYMDQNAPDWRDTFYEVPSAMRPAKVMPDILISKILIDLISIRGQVSMEVFQQLPGNFLIAGFRIKKVGGI